MSLSIDQIHLLPPAQQEAILNQPALQPPPDVIPNFDDPPNGNVLSYSTFGICMFASALAILINTYARFFCIRRAMVEDYLVIAAFGLFLGYIGHTIWLIGVIGYFVHQWDIRLKDLATFLYVLHVCSNLYAVNMMIMKASILKEWIRIFVPYGTRNSFYWTCTVVMWTNVLFYGACVILQNVSSEPHQRIWDVTVPGITRINIKSAIVAGATVNIVLDLVTLIVPQRAIWSLHMSTEKKIGVSLIFAVGLLACVSAAARLAYTITYFQSDDAIYTISPTSLWCVAEMTCMFLIFCGPAVPAALNGLRGSWIGAAAKRSIITPSTSWPATISKEPNSHRKQRLVDEYGIPLTNYSMGGDFAAEEGRRIQERETVGNSITRTTDFTAREEYTENRGGGETFQSQHPWTNH